jgi:hypothetical protein
MRLSVRPILIRAIVQHATPRQALPGFVQGLVQLALQFFLWRQLGPVLDDGDVVLVHLQQLHLLAPPVGAGLPAIVRLRRWIFTSTIRQQAGSYKDKTCLSPLGAGLPAIVRLRRWIFTGTIRQQAGYICSDSSRSFAALRSIKRSANCRSLSRQLNQHVYRLG